MSFSKTESGERILFVLTEEDAQFLAEAKFKRKLTDDELEQVQKGVEFGLEFWEEVMNVAIDDAVDWFK